MHTKLAGSIRHFTDLKVWEKAHCLFLAILDAIEEFPTRRSATLLAEQLVRSAGSVCANIAEGFNRSRRKFVNSLDIALGEANEAENRLYKARDAGFMAPETAKQRLLAVIEIEKMLTGLRSAIAANENALRESGGEYLAEPSAGEP